MRRYNPGQLAAAYQPVRWNPARVHDQAFGTLLFPGNGLRRWYTTNRVVTEWQVPADLSPFALITWPSTVLPFYVRDNGTRYALRTSGFENLPLIFSVPYAGQTLTADCVFEFWSTSSAGSAVVNDFTAQISRRDQLSCGETTGTQYTATVYSPYTQPYPLYYPITTVPV